MFFAEKDRDQAPEIDDVSMDGWDGYAASRRRITQGWVDADARNAVVLTGDVHRNWANDLKHLKFYNDNRGYVNTKITKDGLTADFRLLDYVTTPGSPRQHQGLLRDPGRGAGAAGAVDTSLWLGLSKPATDDGGDGQLFVDSPRNCCAVSRLARTYGGAMALGAHPECNVKSTFGEILATFRREFGDRR